MLKQQHKGCNACENTHIRRMKGTPGADASTLFKHIKDYLL